MRRSFLLLLAALCVSCASAGAQSGRWTLLGTRTVTDRADHDIVRVTGRRGRLDAVKFEVRGRAVDFRRVIIHFANGGDQAVALRDTIRAGGETRAIDVDGRGRVIRSIEFWYDANTVGRGGRATVRVLGRR
ncbi:MAG: hypothetical protein R2708_02275 [Vicinamibacterales bacterium]